MLILDSNNKPISPGLYIERKCSCCLRVNSHLFEIFYSDNQLKARSIDNLVYDISNKPDCLNPSEISRLNLSEIPFLLDELKRINQANEQKISLLEQYAQSPPLCTQSVEDVHLTMIGILTNTDKTDK